MCRYAHLWDIELTAQSKIYIILQISAITACKILKILSQHFYILAAIRCNLTASQIECVENLLLIAVCFYSLSLLFQLTAAATCYSLVRIAEQKYRWAWLFLAIGLTLMVGRRISPITFILEGGSSNVVDALLSIPISGFLLLGVLGIRKLVLQAQTNQDFLQIMMQFDPLTNCLCRTEIFSRIEQEIDRSKRNHRPFALLEMDIDHFKNVNDQYGHQVGDEILHSLIQISKNELRAIDDIGRIGGEEFLILLPETSEGQALEIAERLRARIEQTLHQTSAPKPISITISIGVTLFSPQEHSELSGNDLEQKLIKQADIAMYQAKNAGRNRVTLWSTTGC